MRGASVTPGVTSTLFPPQVIQAGEAVPTHKSNISRRRTENDPIQRNKSIASDEYGDADIDDETLVKAVGGGLGFEHIDDFARSTDAMNCDNTKNSTSIKGIGRPKYSDAATEDAGHSEPAQLPNGRWPCNHKCKDKEACKHYCCKHGMDRPPKKAGLKRGPIKGHQEQSPLKGSSNDKAQTKLQLTSSKRETPAEIEELDLTQQEKKRKKEYSFNGPHEYRDLHTLHKSVQKKDMPPSLHLVMHTRPEYRYEEGGEYQLSFLAQKNSARSKTSSDYGDLEFDKLADKNPASQGHWRTTDKMTPLHYFDGETVAPGGSETYGDNDSMFGEALVGLADSQDLQGANAMCVPRTQNCEAEDAVQVPEDLFDVEFPSDLDYAATGGLSYGLRKRALETSNHVDCQTKSRRAQGPFIEGTSSPEQSRHFESAVFNPHGKEDQELQHVEVGSQQPAPASREASIEGDKDGDIHQELLNLLDGKPPIKEQNFAAEQTLIKSNTTTKAVKLKEELTEDIPDSFQDLQPWLFQEFGDIVELVDE